LHLPGHVTGTCDKFEWGAGGGPGEERPPRRNLLHLPGHTTSFCDKFEWGAGGVPAHPREPVAVAGAYDGFLRQVRVGVWHAPAMSDRLNGRRVLVLGAGTRPSPEPDAPPGNGRTVAVAAAREGATVACVDMDPEACAETVRLVEEAGGKAVAIIANVLKAEACKTLVADAHEALGGLDGLVCNVGIGIGRGMSGTTVEDWDRVFAVNVRSHFLVAGAALELMPEGGSIVFISSVAGLQPGSRIPAYDASKAALAGLSRHVALEGSRRGVRANVIAPGLIDTPLGRLASAGRPSRARTPVPLGRQGTAWEVAGPVVFLLSDDASYVTGQILAVDGGLSTLM
jgi:NAD(P)-dependent dehydrogenase (short-subunit alcohol dehydrogenase family)